MKYFGFGGGWLVENFAIIPGISYNWMRTNKRVFVGHYNLLGCGSILILVLFVKS